MNEIETFTEVLTTQAFMLERKRAFQLALQTDGLAYQELFLYCRARDTVARDNPYLMYLLEGRRQVFLRIQQHHDLSVEELVKRYKTMGDYYG